MGIESSLKLLEYVNRVAKEPIVLNGEPFGNPPVVKVSLNESFFHKDGCVMCGRCCLNETTAWTDEGMSRIKGATPEDFAKWELDYGVVEEIMGRMTENVVDINGKQVSFFVCDKDKTSEAFHLSWPDRKASPRCHWLFEKDGTYRCRVHPVRSVTCGMPHCRFFHNVKTHSTSIGVSQYGRNWALKCPVQFGGFDEESTQSRILWLERLNEVADDCGVKTFLPEILDYLHAGNRSPAVFEATTKRKLFSVR
jgi:Fe-S-cluster containining protein